MTKIRENAKFVLCDIAEAKSVSVDEVSLKNSVVMIGNEGSGLPDSLADAADKRVILPISENSESLNAAMAATVFAWELSRAVRNNS